METKVVSGIAARAKRIEENIKEEMSDIEEFRTRGPR